MNESNIQSLTVSMRRRRKRRSSLFRLLTLSHPALVRHGGNFPSVLPSLPTLRLIETLSSSSTTAAAVKTPLLFQTDRQTDTHSVRRALPRARVFPGRRCACALLQSSESSPRTPPCKPTACDPQQQDVPRMDLSPLLICATALALSWQSSAFRGG